MGNLIKRKGRNRLAIEPQPFYKNVGAVQLQVQKEKYAESDDEMGSLSMFQHYSGDSENENAFTLQLRGFSSYSEHSKPKGFITSLSLTESDIKALYEFAKEMREVGGFGKLVDPKIIDERDGND